jgi:hypothetical protein
MTEAGVRPCDAIDLSGGKLLSGFRRAGFTERLVLLGSTDQESARLDKQNTSTCLNLRYSTSAQPLDI